MRGVKKLLLVEDTYGVDFHRVLIGKVLGGGVLGVKTLPMPAVRRLPAKKCNPAIFKKIMGMVAGLSGSWRAMVVIDSEGRSPDEAVSRDFMIHVWRHRERFRVLAVEPRHEAWLCIGLGGDRSRCRSRPERVIESMKRRPYEKSMLAGLAGDVSVERLLGERDFMAYVDGLRWLLSPGQHKSPP